MHRFWDCIHVRRAREFTNKIINWVVYGSCMSRYTVPTHWKCSVFAAIELRQFHKVGVLYEVSFLG